VSTLITGGNDRALTESGGLQFLAAVTEVLAQADKLGDGCHGVLRAVCEKFHADRGAIYFVGPNATVQPGYAWPEDAPNAIQVDLALINESVLSPRRTVLSPHLSWRKAPVDGHKDAQVLVVPLCGRDAVAVNGVLVIVLSTDEWLDSITQEALLIAVRQLGVFIEVAMALPLTDASDHAQVEAHLQARLRESEAQLYEAGLRYQTLVEQIPVLTYRASLDDRHRLLYISPQAQDWLGYSPQQCIDAPDWWAQVIHPDDLARIVNSTWRSNGEVAKTSSEYRMVTRTGQELWVRDGARAACDEQGRTLFVQGAITDITERKRFQEEMGVSLAREHELNELKTRFITTVSHEFRTPLSRILSAAELIERYGEKITPEKRRNYVDQIRASITFIADMLQEVLLVGNYEAGIATVDVKPIDLEQFCVELVQQMQIALGRRCRLIFDSRGDCLSARIDTRVLKQILSNLLNNAIRYSTQPDPTVEFTLECDGNRAIFRITDHGIGIPDEDQHRIFDAFFRGSNVSLIAGTGLGLAVVRNAVQAHRGEISFQSERDKGTTFTVSLPLR